ncbi:hypothetical protein AB0F42_26220 [Streptomyces buecherae]
MNQATQPATTSKTVKASATSAMRRFADQLAPTPCQGELGIT